MVGLGRLEPPTSPLSVLMIRSLLPVPIASQSAKYFRLTSYPSIRKKNWDAMFADPAFQEMVKSEQADKLVEKVDVTYMHPTDFSPMK
jgi:hypothetical protein